MHWFGKAILLVVISVPIVAGFYYAAVRRPAVVPSRMQFTGELVYDFVRTGIGRESIGSRDYKQFVPLLLTLFSFILVNNLFGITPFVDFSPHGAHRLPNGAGNHRVACL